LNNPPEGNAEEMGKKAYEGKYAVNLPVKRLLLYRGLGLPENAIQVYRDYQKSGKPFQFTGFTSTSCDEEKALMFAHQAHVKGQGPVLLVLDARHWGSGCS
jgi:hypothetical protein